ncbi:MAG TPA: helix-turn-helix transcriptional regulator [Gemmatimonadales bacterium]|nr:helix-turn-helix transcriptional regulator [Gemmatimonadales bacterium]
MVRSIDERRAAVRRLRDPEDLLPLSHPVFHILLALGDGPRHGYAIRGEVAAQTEGEAGVRSGTLYATIHRMVRDGLLEETGDRPAESDDERRRYYRLTPFGREVAAAEAARLAVLLRVARSKGLVGPAVLREILRER